MASVVIARTRSQTSRYRWAKIPLKSLSSIDCNRWLRCLYISCVFWKLSIFLIVIWMRFSKRGDREVLDLVLALSLLDLDLAKDGDESIPAGIQGCDPAE